MNSTSSLTSIHFHLVFSGVICFAAMPVLNQNQRKFSEYSVAWLIENVSLGVKAKV